MATELIDGALCTRLFAHYRPALGDYLRSPVTGMLIRPPSDPAQQGNLLNLLLFDPQAMLCWTGPLTYAHLRVWQAYLKASRHRLAVLCDVARGRRQDALNLGAVPLYEGEAGFSVKTLLPLAPALGALLYPVNTLENVTSMRRFPSLMHVHVGHGDSDKHTSATRANMSYDFIMLANQHAMDRYRRAGVEIEPARFLAVGGTVVPGVVPRTARAPLANVLYAPTFEGNVRSGNFSSVVRARDALLAFAAAAPERLHCQLHPALGRRDPAYAETSRALAERQGTPPMLKDEAFNWSDLIVCDISGVLSEYLFTGKPIVLPISAGDDRLLLERVAAAGLPAFAYLWDYRAIGLADFLASIADDPLRDARLARRRALFLGAESFAESVALFDEAIDHVLASRTMRRRRQQTDKPVHVPRPLPAHPDPTLNALVDEIRAGRTVLRAEASRSDEPEDAGGLDD